MDVSTFLTQAVGEWQGEYRLWFEPADEPHAQSATHATVTAELGGTGALLRYDWVNGADQHHGIAVLGRTDDGGLQMGWKDTFHYRDGVMHNAAVGPVPEVLGEYGSPEEPWGWRTQFNMPSSHELEIRAFNILPDGLEVLATEAIYQRVV